MLKSLLSYKYRGSTTIHIKTNCFDYIKSCDGTLIVKRPLFEFASLVSCLSISCYAEAIYYKLHSLIRAKLLYAEK